MNASRSIFAFALSLAWAMPAVAAPQIELEYPMGGWRNSENERIRFTQEVHYPASRVNTAADQSKAGLIQGRIRGQILAAPKSPKAKDKRRLRDDQKKVEPLKLIVNGTDLPLRPDADRFSRPFMFGAGSNSVEVRMPGTTAGRSRAQFFEGASGMVSPKLSVILAWDTDMTDLDLHVIGPDGSHCFYGNRVLDNGSALDVDVTSGYGPEIYSNPSPLPGEYLVYLNYYGSGGGSDLTVARVTVIYNQGSADERKETVTIPMRRAGDLTLAHSFIVK